MKTRKTEKIVGQIVAKCDVSLLTRDISPPLARQLPGDDAISRDARQYGKIVRARIVLR